MSKCKLAVMCVAWAGFLATSTWAEEVSKVSLEVKDTPAAEALAQLQKQVPTVTLCATEATKEMVSVSLKEATLEEAVKAIADGVKGTYVRGYIIERMGPGDQPYTAAEYIDFLQTARREWQQRLTPEQQQALRQRLGAGMRQRFAPPAAAGQVGGAAPAGANPGGPGAGGQPAGAPPVAGQPPAGPFAGGNGTRDPFAYDDPLRELAFMPHTERITLDLDNAALQKACDEFTFQSGYLVLLEEKVEGLATIHEKDQELPKLLDKLAESGQAKWRAFYVISQPLKLSEEEVEKRMDAGFSRGWQQFWSQTPEERATLVQRVVQGLQSLPPQVGERIRSNPRARGMFTRFINANAQLTPEQRREIQPMVQAISKFMGN